MAVIILSLVLSIVGALGTVMFILEKIYTRPKLEALTPITMEMLAEGRNVRVLMIPVRNRRGCLATFTQREPAINVSALLSVNLPGVEGSPKPGRWIQGFGQSQPSEPGASVTLAEGEVKHVCGAWKMAGERDCKFAWELPIPEGTYLVSLYLGATGAGRKFHYVLNNRTVELARLQIRGPISEEEGLRIVHDPEKYFPLGGMG